MTRSYSSTPSDLVDSEVSQERRLGGTFAFDGPKEILVIEALVPLLELPASLMLERQEARSR